MRSFVFLLLSLSVLTFGCNKPSEHFALNYTEVSNAETHSQNISSKRLVDGFYLVTNSNTSFSRANDSVDVFIDPFPAVNITQIETVSIVWNDWMSIYELQFKFKESARDSWHDATIVAANTRSQIALMLGDTIYAAAIVAEPMNTLKMNLSTNEEKRELKKLIETLKVKANE